MNITKPQSSSEIVETSIDPRKNYLNEIEEKDDYNVEKVIDDNLMNATVDKRKILPSAVLLSNLSKLKIAYKKKYISPLYMVRVFRSTCQQCELDLSNFRSSACILIVDDREKSIFLWNGKNTTETDRKCALNFTQTILVQDWGFVNTTTFENFYIIIDETHEHVNELNLLLQKLSSNESNYRSKKLQTSRLIHTENAPVIIYSCERVNNVDNDNVNNDTSSSLLKLKFHHQQDPIRLEDKKKRDYLWLQLQHKSNILLPSLSLEEGQVERSVFPIYYHQPNDTTNSSSSTIIIEEPPHGLVVVEVGSHWYLWVSRTAKTEDIAETEEGIIRIIMTQAQQHRINLVSLTGDTASHDTFLYDIDEKAAKKHITLVHQGHESLIFRQYFKHLTNFDPLYSSSSKEKTFKLPTKATNDASTCTIPFKISVAGLSNQQKKTKATLAKMDRFLNRKSFILKNLEDDGDRSYSRNSSISPNGNRSLNEDLYTEFEGKSSPSPLSISVKSNSPQNINNNNNNDSVLHTSSGPGFSSRIGRPPPPVASFMRVSNSKSKVDTMGALSRIKKVDVSTKIPPTSSSLSSIAHPHHSPLIDRRKSLGGARRSSFEAKGKDDDNFGISFGEVSDYNRSEVNDIERQTRGSLPHQEWNHSGTHAMFLTPAEKYDLIDMSATKPEVLIGYQIEIDEGFLEGVHLIRAVSTDMFHRPIFQLSSYAAGDQWSRLSRGKTASGGPLFRPLKKIFDLSAEN